MTAVARRRAQVAAEWWCGVSWTLLIVAGMAGAMIVAGLAAVSAVASMLTIERLSLEVAARRRSARAAGEAERAERAERAAAREAVAS